MYVVFVEGAPKVAIIREEGSNGDREMAAAFTLAGFEPWDINMQDLLDGHIKLDTFRGIAFVGGFSYADVCGSAKGKMLAIFFDFLTISYIILNFIDSNDSLVIK